MSKRLKVTVRGILGALFRFAAVLMATGAVFAAVAAQADDAHDLNADRFGWVAPLDARDMEVGDGGWSESWSFGPLVGIGTLGHGLSGGGTGDGGQSVRIGFKSFAKVDSRIGALYSRVSLSFDQALRGKDDRTASRLSGGGRHGYYAGHSKIDVMVLDAAFALPLARDVSGFVGFGAAMDPGSDAEHQILLRLRIGF